MAFSSARIFAVGGGLFACGLALGLSASSAQEVVQARPGGTIQTLPAAPQLHWPLPANAPRSYASIDGDRMKGYVQELADISHRSRARGDKVWGRIAGEPSGVETQAWLADKMRKSGLEVEIKEIDLAPQAYVREASIVVQGAGKTLDLGTASPIINFADYTPSDEGTLDLDSVWVGLGTASDFLGRDVRGKAVFIYSAATPSSLIQSAQYTGAAERAQKAGAKALVIVLAIPGNMRFVSHLQGSRFDRNLKLPIMIVGMDDGANLEKLYNEAGGAGVKTRVHWRLERKTGLKGTIVVGKLAGRTDENIVMISHTDGYFEGATDNGAGTAALIETGAYYAKIPRAQRRRTMYFIGVPDHHNGDTGARWLHNNMQSVFAKTAVSLNAEHVTAMEPVWDRAWGDPSPPKLIPTNQLGSSWWGVYGSPRLATIIRDSFAMFGVPTQIEPGGSAGELRAIQWDSPSFYLHNKGVFYHADSDVVSVVPATGLRTAVQAFVKIFDDVNKLDLAAVRPDGYSPPAAR